MRKSSILLVVLFTCIQCYSQGCPTTDIPDYYFLYEIEEFVNEYPDCSRLPSTLIMHNGDLTNVAGLSQIDSISGSLVCNECAINSYFGLENLKYIGQNFSLDEPHSVPHFENLQGLNNLEYIGGYFKIEEGDGLISTNGLDNLQYVGGINIYESEELIEIVGFEEISEIPGSIILSENYALPNLSGFSNFSTVGGDVNIDEMDGLNSLEGLENIETIGGSLVIQSNPILENIDALSSVISIEDNIILWNNNSLNSLIGLSSVAEFNGEVSVYNCDELASLSGIENIDEQYITDLTLMNNENLNNCSLDNICSYLTNNIGPALVELNAEGCNTENEITDDCALVDINDTTDAATIEIYPNPFSDEAIVRCNIEFDKIELRITDHMGRLVRVIRNISGHEILIKRGELKSGFYSLSFIKNNTIIDSSKIVIKYN
jgi:hypothetical protein